MKIIMKQVPYEQMGYEPFENWGFTEENFVIEGNKRLVSFNNSEIFQNVKDALENGELYDALWAMEAEGNCYWLPYTKYQIQVIQEYLPKANGKRYSIRELLALKKALKSWERNCDDEYFVDILSIVSSKKWERAEIRGSGQSDWNNLYYVKAEIDVQAIEAAYFGLYSEWFIDKILDMPEKFSEAYETMVFQIFDYLDIKEFLTKQFNAIFNKEATVNESDITLLFHDGWMNIPTYKEA